MNIEEINKKIQAEKDSFNRDLNRLQQEILKLKERHQRTMSDLKSQKQQAKNQVRIQTNENLAKLYELIQKALAK